MLDHRIGRQCGYDVGEEPLEAIKLVGGPTWLKEESFGDNRRR